MKITIAIPFFNHLNDVKGVMGLLKFVTSDSIEWLIIDNGSSEPIEDFFRHTLRPKRLNFVRNPENIGMIKTYQQIFDAVETDVVAVLHNDVFIYEKHWDQRVLHMFKTIKGLGSLGFFGASGVGNIGDRIQDTDYHGQMSGISNMLEAKEHGIHMLEEYLPVSILDGFAMIFNMKMIKKAGGIDDRYHFHHVYDRDLPLTSLMLGYKNIVLNVPCHHMSGTTAVRSTYQEWIQKKLGRKDADHWTMRENMRLFQQKWNDVLPVYVERDFSFRNGVYKNRAFKGDKIVGFNPSKDH